MKIYLLKIIKLITIIFGIFLFTNMYANFDIQTGNFQNFGHTIYIIENTGSINKYYNNKETDGGLYIVDYYNSGYNVLYVNFNINLSNLIIEETSSKFIFNINQGTDIIDISKSNITGTIFFGLAGASGITYEDYVSYFSTTNNNIISGTCGTNAQSYEYIQTEFSSTGTFCETGTQNLSPLFPGQGKSVSWTCEGSNGGTNATCSASRGVYCPSGEFVNGECKVATSSSNTIYFDLSLAYNITDSDSSNKTSNGATLKENKSIDNIKLDTDNAGDPVNLATGEFDYTNTLMSIPGQGQPYEFSMSYKNQSYYNGPVGINWDHNYNKYLVTEDNENILYYNGKLGTFRFIKNGSNYDYNLGLKANLTLSGGLYELTYDDGRKEYFNSNKKLSSQSDKYGNTLNFTYSGGLLAQATDTLGRNIDYTYDNNRLTEVTDFNSNKVKLIYYTGTTNSGSLYDLKEITIDNSGNGASNSSNTKTISFEYTTGGNDITNHNITKLIDSKGQTYVVNTYDDDRVLTQTYGDGTITYDYTITASGTVSKNSVTNKVGDITDYFYDENGQNTSTTYHTDNGNITYEYTYDSDGYMTTLKKPNGNGTSYTYDSRGNILEKRQKEDIEASDSTSDIITTNTYNSRNQVLTKTLPNGVVITNTYDTDGNLTQTTTSGLKDSSLNTYSTTRNFEYNELGELTKSTDARGLETTFTYSGGLLTETTSGTGTNARTTTLTYNDYGVLTSKTDPRGNTSNYEITNFNQTGTGITAEGIIKSYVYDENNNITKEINHINSGTVETNYTYDVLDNPTEIANDITSTKELITNIEYDANGNITSKTIGSGATIKYTYNEFSKVIEEKIIKDENDSGKDIITSYEYDDNGNLISKTDPLGNITAYTYDLYDRLKTTTKPDGTYTKIFYNDDDTISQVFEYDDNDTLLTKTQYVYNGAGKVLKEITYKDPINNTGSIITNTDYDNNGNIISKIDALGNQTTFTYDEFNNLIQSEDELGNRVINTYDKNNNLTQKEILQNNSKSTTTIYVYDDDNRLVSETDELNKTKSYTYNDLNQITSITDEMGNITNYTYDYAGNVLGETKVTSNGNITTSYTYDERGNNTSITDGEGNTTTYEYNNLNELVKTTYEDGKYITYAYDKAGNLVSQTDPNGNITTNTYDDLNRLVSRNIQTGTGVLGVTSETYSYDDLGRLIEANDSNNHKLEFSYDTLNRLTQEKSPHPNPLPEGEGMISVNYTYDDNNNLLSITNPQNNTTSYTYDELNRLTQVKQNTDTIATYTYTGILNDVINYGNNTNITKGYDSLNRLSSLNNSVKDYTYTYDDVSNITSDAYKDFTYDDIYRLTQVNESNSGTLLESYDFDDVGNRLSDTENNEYTTNDLNQYTTLSGVTNINFSYDDNGNLIQNDEYTFSYDYKNRLVKVENLSGSGIIAEFSYDVLGRRYEKVAGNETTKYVYSNENVLLEYKTSNGVNAKKEYINGLGTDDLIAVDQDESDLSLEERGELNFCETNVLTNTGGFIQYGWNDIVDRCESLALSGTTLTNNRYYFSKNHLGSVDGITDNSGSVIVSYEYDSYGNFVLSGSDIGNTRLFTGREYDSEIGLYYFRARYYDSEIGRFISRDPIGQDGGINIYEYVNGNPISFVDLIGTNEKSVVIETIDITLQILQEINNNIDYDPLIKTGEKLQMFGATGITIGGTACVYGTLSTAGGGVVISCGGGGIVALDGAIIGAGGSLMKIAGETGKKFQSGNGGNPSHLNSDFLKNQNKIKSKNGRPRYDNGKTGKNREIYEWDPSHGGEIELYIQKGSKGVHQGVLSPGGKLIKEAVKGRTIDL